MTYLCHNCMTLVSVPYVPGVITCPNCGDMSAKYDEDMRIDLPTKILREYVLRGR